MIALKQKIEKWNGRNAIKWNGKNAIKKYFTAKKGKWEITIKWINGNCYIYIRFWIFRVAISTDGYNVSITPIKK